MWKEILSQDIDISYLCAIMALFQSAAKLYLNFVLDEMVRGRTRPGQGAAGKQEPVSQRGAVPRRAAIGGVEKW